MDSQTGSVLVVDTDDGLRRILDLILSRADYDVQSVESPMEALGLISVQTPDLVILDISPSEEHASTFVRLARRLGWQGPVIVLSTDSGWRLSLREVEADAGIRKPFSPEELLGCVAKLLGEHRKARSGAYQEVPRPTIFDFPRFQPQTS